MMPQEKAFFGSFYSNNKKAYKQNLQNSNGANLRGVVKQIETTTEKLTWSFQAVPTLYSSLYQKVDTKMFLILFLEAPFINFV